jgi:hypothetical protein
MALSTYKLFRLFAREMPFLWGFLLVCLSPYSGILVVDFFYIFSGQHRLPLAHQCSEYKGNDLLQCDDCEQLIKPQETLSNQEAVSA